jgi:hypothetical protein
MFFKVRDDKDGDLTISFYPARLLVALQEFSIHPTVSGFQQAAVFFGKGNPLLNIFLNIGT